RPSVRNLRSAKVVLLRRGETSAPPRQIAHRPRVARLGSNFPPPSKLVETADRSYDDGAGALRHGHPRRRFPMWRTKAFWYRAGRWDDNNAASIKPLTRGLDHLGGGT